MRVLVTGGAGMIGSHVVEEMLRGSHEVSVLDNLDPQVHPAGRPDWIPDSIRFVHGDIRDPAALDRALQGCEGVIHLAAFGGVSPEFSKIADVNATGTARLFEAVRRSGRVRKVVCASSMAVYGEGCYACPRHGAFPGRPRPIERLQRAEWSVVCPVCGADAVAAAIDESTPVAPSSTYACSKYFTERMTLNECRDLGIGGVALRYFLTFGPRQSVHNPYCGICSIFSTRIVNGLAPVVYEDGLQTRDVVYVADAARATRLVFERSEADGGVYNVARETGVSIADLARGLARAHGSDLAPVCPGRFRPMDNRHMLGSARRLKDLGWVAEVGIDEGLRRYVEWMRTLPDVGEPFSAAERDLRRHGIVRGLADADG